MPRSLDESTRKDAIYPDEMARTGDSYLIDADRLNGTVQTWDASDPDDAEALPEDAQYGEWLPVIDAVDPEYGEPVWLAAPRALRETLLEAGAEPGDAFRVLAVEKGPEDHDPYEIEIEHPYET